MDFSWGSQFQRPSLKLWLAKSRDWARVAFLPPLFQLRVFVVRCSQNVICGESPKDEWEANNAFTPCSTACFTAFSKDPILLRLVWLQAEQTLSFSTFLLLRFDKRYTVSLGRDKISFLFVPQTARSTTGQLLCVKETVTYNKKKKRFFWLVFFYRK